MSNAGCSFQEEQKKRTWPFRILISFAFCLLMLPGFSQGNTDSCTLEISLLTCSPGTELYSLFGHTAIRVRDDRRGMDVVYNYGTFDDSDPLFYFHFTRGIMVYSLSASTFQDFMVEYEYEHRGVIEQMLNLSCAQKKNLYEALRENTTEQNRFYNYHFYADNCTTRAGKIIVANSDSFRFANILPDSNPTYRKLIHAYLERQQQWWSEFGIDLLLGANLDKKPSNEQVIYFLPDYLMTGMDHAQNALGPVVAKKRVILQQRDQSQNTEWFTPIFLFGVLLVCCGLLSLLRNRASQIALKIFDVLLFAILGLLGFLLLYVWIFRVDEVCRNNINICWAIPTHLIAICLIRKNPFWLKYYFQGNAALAAILLTGFAWWPQQMNRSLLLLLPLIILRSVNMYLTLSNAKKHTVSGNTRRL
ncbi:MAG TPA: DUF4105 domain-containing protein [Puia sp.]|nr:DUF4105 domain-containing protein [Puia sp.]